MVAKEMQLHYVAIQQSGFKFNNMILGTFYLNILGFCENSAGKVVKRL